MFVVDAAVMPKRKNNEKRRDGVRIRRYIQTDGKDLDGVLYDVKRRARA